MGRRSLPLSTGTVLHLLLRRILCRCTSDDEKSSIFFTNRVSELSESAKVSALALSAWQILRTVYRNTLPVMSVKVSSSPASSWSAIWVSGMAPICGIRLTKGLTIISGSIFSEKSNQNNGERRRNIFAALPALDQGKLYFTGWWYIIKYEKTILWRLWPLFSPPNTNIANICLRLMTKQHML